MSKTVISFFSFGIALIIIGALFKVMHWPQATTLLALGLTFESLAIVIFAYQKLKK